MKKLTVILILAALLIAAASPVLAAAPVIESNHQSHGQAGEGSVNQRFNTNPFWYVGVPPWELPPGLQP